MQEHQKQSPHSTQNSEFKGEIKLEFEGLPADTIGKYESVIRKLITVGAFNVKNGKTILHWDHEGTLREIEIDFKAWRLTKK